MIAYFVWIKFLLIVVASIYIPIIGFTCNLNHDNEHQCLFNEKDINYEAQHKIAESIDYSSFDFHSPLDIPPVLAANFGELRSNHFHTGLDFKTNRQEGLNIYSIDDGYVSRIKVSPWGYGHVVYIDHYNGLTSVYAHCSYFVDELAQLVKNQQKKSLHFEIDYFLPKDSLKVNKGQVIALSGNTGGSSAPHLHFEIRDTKSEHPLNPLLFGFGISDNVKPQIRSGRVYSVTEDGYRIPYKAKNFSIVGTNGNYRVPGNILSIDANYLHQNGGIGFAFDAIDQLDAANNICGIHESILIIDGDTIYHQSMAEISFSSNRYINVHKDYEQYHKNQRHFQKTFKTSSNPLPIYKKAVKNGILFSSPNKSHQIAYICKDVHGNESNLTFELQIQEGSMNQEKLYGSGYLYPDSAFMDIQEDYSILFPPGLVYEPTALILNYQNTLFFGNSSIPLQDKFRIMMRIKNNNLPDEKYLITRKNNSNRKYAQTGSIHKGWITSWFKDFGEFQVEIDTTPPRIIYKNFTDGGMTKGNQLVWRFQDDLSGIKNYRLFINDEYYVLKYEYKHSGNYYFEIPPNLKGEKNILIEVEDHCNNLISEKYKITF